MTTTNEENEGRKLAATLRRREDALAAARADVDTWVTARLEDGWSAWRCAQVLGIAYPALRRKLDRQGVNYDPHPKGGPRKQPA